jgi:hypothetical protein
MAAASSSNGAPGEPPTDHHAAARRIRSYSHALCCQFGIMLLSCTRHQALLLRMLLGAVRKASEEDKQALLDKVDCFIFDCDGEAAHAYFNVRWLPWHAGRLLDRWQMTRCMPQASSGGATPSLRACRRRWTRSEPW